MKLNDRAEKLNETKELVESMVMELRFRGCDKDHPLIKRALELARWLGTLTGDAEKTADG